MGRLGGATTTVRRFGVRPRVRAPNSAATVSTQAPEAFDDDRRLHGLRARGQPPDVPDPLGGGHPRSRDDGRAGRDRVRPVPGEQQRHVDLDRGQVDGGVDEQLGLQHRQHPHGLRCPDRRQAGHRREQGLERRALLGVVQPEQRPRHVDGHARPLRLRVDEGDGGGRQRAHRRGTVGRLHLLRRPARRVVEQLRLRLEHDDGRATADRRGERQPRDPAADDRDVGRDAHASISTRPVLRALFILGCSRIRAGAARKRPGRPYP